MQADEPMFQPEHSSGGESQSDKCLILRGRGFGAAVDATG
jgi:hypothetical protein